MMIENKKKIRIEAFPEGVFDLIETMPNKFPIYSFLEAKPFLFLRLLLVDGLGSAVEAIRIDLPKNELILNVGDSLGPFTLTEVERPTRYWFTVRSFFFNCRTGYSLRGDGHTTILNFDIISEKASFREKVYWFFIKPFHAVFASKVLRNIKKTAEGSPDAAGTR